MEELSFKIVKVQDAQDEVIALVGNFVIGKAAFDKALFVYPKDYLEMRQGGARIVLKSKRIELAPEEANSVALAFVTTCPLEEHERQRSCIKETHPCVFAHPRFPRWWHVALECRNVLCYQLGHAVLVR